MAKANVAQDGLDFGPDAPRVDKVITAAYQVGALVTMLQASKDPLNLMECMAILGLKMHELLDMQVSALTDSMAGMDEFDAVLGCKEASHV